ncbi:alpha/beta fold hydrolase [Embleya sp. NBC_00896]|uniref:alpha/beta fold hydrolase n=1 Tax=Embleya sp. NBC_00896 TaxID=2975961 RepID=UPI0038653FB4
MITNWRPSTLEVHEHAGYPWNSDELSPGVAHRFADADGARVFSREAGPADAPVLLLLHGFPSASHQFRRLIDVPGNRFRLVAPDHPGLKIWGVMDHRDRDRLTTGTRTDQSHKKDDLYVAHHRQS